jgi:hypothetical protein
MRIDRPPIVGEYYLFKSFNDIESGGILCQCVAKNPSDPINYIRLKWYQTFTYESSWCSHYIGDLHHISTEDAVLLRCEGKI